MGLFESNEEKKFDVRFLDRAKAIGKLEKKTAEEAVKRLADDAEHALTVNLDELNARDNPVHMARNLPTHDKPVRTNFEDMEFDADETNRNFEH
jgi:hypothetical protein